MNFVEEYLNLIKRKIGLTQEDIANELNYSRGYISMAKKSPTNSFSDILLKTFGFVKPGDKSYEKTLNDLKQAVAIIKEKTGLSEYALSKHIYGKESNIPDSLNGDWVSPRMTIAIKKNFSYIFDGVEENIKFASEYNNVEYLKILKQLPEFKNADILYKILSEEMEPFITSNVIIAGRKITPPFLPNRIYLIELLNGQIAIGNKIIEDNESITIYPSNKKFDPSNIKKDEIKYYFEAILKFSISGI